MSANEFGVIGLGRMGGGLAALALEKGFGVVGLSNGGAPQPLLDAGLVGISDIAGFKQLSRPRVVMLYIPAGPPIDQVLEQLAGVLEPGDVIVDGGNSYRGDSIRRHDRLHAKGLEFIDPAPGGVSGAREGACFMAGGDAPVVAVVEPILRALSVPDG